MDQREDKPDPVPPDLPQELERALAAESRARGDIERLRQALEALTLENARLSNEVEKLTTVDALTGLHCRGQFDTASRIEFRRSLRFRLKLSVIMMDIDRLMRVNDGYGRIAGDKVLAGVADVCLRGIRMTDLHARYGGEEFCFLLPETDQKGAHVLAERLRTAVAGLRFQTDKRSFSVTVSVGIAERQSDTDSIERLLEQSDQALFKAKCEGRNRIVTWTEQVGKFWKPG
ncbi:GGDEF domain-containing protein [Candidatus Deferrimicrobium sp.]|uniref:GGDEF domain-containing protein n=1 Tax=Candidatus Deferrimicrobium sp. TaxID=3060586 RepID=UPI003C3E0D69